MFQFTLTGRLAADPELTTYGPDDTPMARLRVASNQPGVPETSYFDVAVFGDNALAALATARKGDRVHLTGNGRQHTWTTASGETRERIRLATRSIEHTPRQTSDTAAADQIRAAAPAAAR